MTTRHIQLADILETMADAIPDRVALHAGHVTLTYAELDERATRLAHHLAANGVGHGDHVGVHSTNRAEWVETYYACFKLRAVPININYRYVESELRYLYDNSDCVAIVVGPDFVDVVEAVRDTMPDLRLVLVMGDDYEAALAAASPDRDFGERSADDIYIVYTGGTTGMPKGVIWRHGDLVPGALNAFRMGADVDSTERLAAEAAANNPTTLMFMGPMMHGGCQWALGTIHLIGGAFVLYCEPRFDADVVLEMAERLKVDALSVIGDAMGRPIAERILDPHKPRYDLTGIFAISNGAAPLTPGVRKKLRAAFPTSILTDGYGSSETGTTGVGTDPVDHASPRFTIGPETTVFAEDFTVAPVGETGLLARSGHIPLGYLKDEEKTTATFPVVDGTRWVIPGDHARREEEGSITLLGRGSGSINSGGEKIFPEEVEAALMQHEGITDAVVVGTPHERWGQQVTALVQRTDGANVEVDELRAHCKTLIADYKAPKEVLFVDHVVRTPVGKLDYTNAKATANRALGIEED
ncbi:MAG: acyl-CoA synthetase [Acidimicrobiia bacterium]|nr:acyl-CoA synthetase [Acidimicrobiia bacterium]